MSRGLDGCGIWDEMDFLDAVKFAGENDAVYEVGIITRDIPNVDGYKENDVVVFRKENFVGYGDSLTVATPHYSSVLKNGIVEYDQLFFHNAIVNVPSEYVNSTSLLDLVYI